MSDHHDLGLSHDLPLLLSRRRAIAMLGGAGLGLLLTRCGTGSGSSSSAPSGASTAEIPEKTAGPFPADGSNGVNALTESGIVRSDITHSFGSASGLATGVPLQVRLRVVDVGGGSAPMQGAAVYLWHCDAVGRYSLYDQEISAENYLRGVQVADADGWLSFTSVYPAAYSGRLAAHPFRGLSQRRDLGRCAPRSSRSPTMSAGPCTPRTGTPGASTTCRGRRSTATSRSATATRCRWRRSPALPPTATRPR